MKEKLACEIYELITISGLPLVYIKTISYPFLIKFWIYGQIVQNNAENNVHCTKMKFSIQNFFS